MEHSQTRTLTHNQRYKNNNRVYPGFAKPSHITDREAAYYAALDLVARIDEDLIKGTRHYRNKAGVLLTTLDEVIHAILDDNLLLKQEEAEMRWVAPQELAA